MRKRLGGIIALAISVLVLWAAPALAHVTIEPGSAPKGSETKLTFRVPNEAPLADTISFDVKFDVNHPIASVQVKPKPGWTVAVAKAPLKAPLQTSTGPVTDAVSEITWSGGAIPAGQFDEFEVDVSPLPVDVDLLVFPSVQTYSDGTVVSWIQQAFAGQPEPANPAPQLTLTAAAGTETAKKSSSSNNTRNLAIAAFLVGGAGLVVGGWAWWNVRRWR